MTLGIKLPVTQHNVKKNLSMLVLESVVHSVCAEIFPLYEYTKVQLSISCPVLYYSG